jgi:hypothetical protein
MGTGHYEHDHQHLEEKPVGVDGRSSVTGARRLRRGQDTIEQADELDKEGASRGEPPRVACLDTRHIRRLSAQVGLRDHTLFMIDPQLVSPLEGADDECRREGSLRRLSEVLEGLLMKV